MSSMIEMNVIINVFILVYEEQECQISHPNWVGLAPNGTNLALLKISFSTFWLGEPKCTETDHKKVPDLSHLVPIRPKLDAKCDTPDQTANCQF